MKRNINDQKQKIEFVTLARAQYHSEPPAGVFKRMWHDYCDNENMTVHDVLNEYMYLKSQKAEFEALVARNNAEFDKIIGRAS